MNRNRTLGFSGITLQDIEDEVFDYTKLLKENGASGKTIRNFLMKDLKSRVARIENGLEEKKTHWVRRKKRAG